VTDVRSSLEDLDYAEAISRFNQQLTALQASQQAFIKVQDLSLFNFLR
jgi:flagellar hook-associated protein 3 FlgL